MNTLKKHSVITALFLSFFINYSNAQGEEAQQLVTKIGTTLKETQQKLSKGILSPAVSQEILRNIGADEIKINLLKLPEPQNTEIQTKLKHILETYASTREQLTTNVATSIFKYYAQAILKKAPSVAITAMQGAAIGMLLQTARNGINSITAPDTTDLQTRAMQNALVAILQANSKSLIEDRYATFISGGNASILTSWLLAGTIPTGTGIFTAAIATEACTIIGSLVWEYISKIDWQVAAQLTIREYNTPAMTLATDAITPVVQNMFKNKTITSTLMNIGGRTLQAAVTGAVFRLFLAAIGAIPTGDIATEISAGVIQGALTGLISEIGSGFTGKEGGIITASSQALVTITSSVAKGTPLLITPQDVLQSIGQATLQTIVPALAKKELVLTAANIVTTRWLSTWNGLVNVVQKVNGSINDFIEKNIVINPGF